MSLYGAAPTLVDASVSGVKPMNKREFALLQGLYGGKAQAFEIEEAEGIAKTMEQTLTDVRNPYYWNGYHCPIDSAPQYFSANI